MGCNLGKESIVGDIENNLRPENNKGTTVSKSKKFNKGFEDINNKTDSVSKVPKFRTKVDSRVTAKYDIKALIGKGSFSDVLRIDCKTSRKPYAVKVLKLRSQQETELLQAELSVLKNTSHRYIIKLKEVIMSKNCTYLVMELATGGELYDRIKSRGHLDEKDSCQITQMLLEGIFYLHGKGITHRDLKPENLLFYHPGNDSKILITDFGFSKIKSGSSDSSLLTTWCGTPEYIAPELLTQKPYNSQVDMWALGVIVYVMLSGHLPFSAETTPKLFEQILQCDYKYTREVWNKVSDSAKDFMNQLLVSEPSTRLNATLASNHPWINLYPHLHKKTKPNLQKWLSTKPIDSLLNIPVKQHISTEQPIPTQQFIPTVSNSQEPSPKKSLQETTKLQQSLQQQNGLVLPFRANFGNNMVSKDRILQDDNSSLSASNIDSLLATEDTNSVLTSNFGMSQQYYTKLIPLQGKLSLSHSSPTDTILMLPTHAGIKLPPVLNTKVITIPPVTGSSVKEGKISVHDQFENIDEDSEDEVYLSINSKNLNLTKLDRLYASNAGSVVSTGSQKPISTGEVKTNKSSYIEKVGIWLTDQGGENASKKTVDQTFNKTDPLNMFTNNRTVSIKSNLIVSDQSHSNSFNRFLMPSKSKQRETSIPLKLMNHKSSVDDTHNAFDIIRNSYTNNSLDANLSFCSYNDEMIIVANKNASSVV